MRPHSRLLSKQSRKFVERKKLKSTLTAIVLMLGAISWTVVASRVTYIEVFTIQNIQVQGAGKEMVATLTATAQDSLQGSYLGMFSRSNAFLYPRSAITAAIMDTSPQIQNATVERDSFHTLRIVVEEKKPDALVCANLPDFSDDSLATSLSDSCYFADASGYIYETAPAFSGSIYNRYYIPDIGDKAGLGEKIEGSYATSTQEFKSLQALYTRFRDAKLDPLAMLVKADGEYEVYIRNPGQAALEATSTHLSTAVIYMNDTRPLLEQFDNLALFWNKAVAEKSGWSGPPQFEYIDVRYGSNVFYRRIQ